MTRVVRVLAPNPGPFTLEGTNTWVVGESPSVVIDPGPDDAGHLRAVVDAAEPIAAILLTHHHPDHAPGAARLAGTTRVPVLSFRPQAGERPLRDGELLDWDRVRLRAVHTPGHSADHVAFLLEGEMALFTGDAVLGRGTSVVDPPDGDMAAYLRSLRAMQQLRPRTLYPGHGPAVFDGPEKLRQYLAHREMRERQVLEALEAGATTPAEMVPGIYGDQVPESMFPAAERSVLAHLLKLERESRVVRRRAAGQERFEIVQPRTCERCGRPAVPGSRFCRRCGLELLQEGPEGGSRPD